MMSKVLAMQWTLGSKLLLSLLYCAIHWCESTASKIWSRKTYDTIEAKHNL